MTLIETLFYKTDEKTNQMRISKTKVITDIVFLLFFIFSINTYLTTPGNENTSMIILFFSSILVGLVFAIPTFIVGWLISKLLNRNKTNNYPNNNGNYNQAAPQNNYNTDTVENTEPKNNPNEYAKQFKKAVENDDVDLASELLSKWNNNDANFKYATIIFEGMPPSELSLTELNEMLNSADNMESYDETLKDWYKSTAVEVINLNK